MRNKVKKALACAAAACLAAGLAFAAGCSGEYHRADALEGDISYTGEAISNGGFAVEAGNYIYFINGVASNTETNTYGEVQKGSLVRISKSDLAAGNYADVQTVVPLLMYGTDYTSGIYIYGDRVYYSTPSTARDSNGEILNSLLEFKSTKLDGTETMTDYYFRIDGTNLDYRIMQGEDGGIYLVYVLSETLYGTEAHTNIHSVNFETGEDTVLAYNVSSYMFDSKDASNPYVYYTMDVTYNLGTTNAVTADYNQVYRVTADAEAPREYDFSYVTDFDEEEDPLYINYGEFVFDGRGILSGMTQFNYGYDPSTDADPSSDDANTISGYTYELIAYEDGNLYYTREYYSGSSQTPILLYATDEEIGSDGWNPVTGNPSAPSYGGQALLYIASDVSGYTFVTDENNVPTGVVYTESSGSAYALMSGTFSGGSIVDTFSMADVSGEITVLAITEETIDGSDYNFLYFSVSGEGNGYTVHRIALGGSEEDYTELPSLEETESHSNYEEIQILDLDADSGWYMPEILSDHLFFASSTDDMADYNYVMTFSLTSADGEAMSNDDIQALNDLYDDVIGDDEDDPGVIASIDADDYENLPNALRYAFYTRNDTAVDELIADWVDAGEDVEYLFSEQSAQMYHDFIAAEGDYAEFAEYSRTVNGETVYATSRDYYYNLVGYMTDDDAEAYNDSLVSDYLPAGPTDDSTWFEGLSTGAKVGFIIGVCVAGLIVIAAAAIIPIVIVRKRRSTLPQYTRRVKVDTTDDKDIDVYGDDSGNGTN